jgi:NAD(P)-dependent dehydrogenase (short-subunit alcohol dehydrogenase family)
MAAQRWPRVVFAVRSIEKGRAAASATLGETEVRALDLASLDSVLAFAARWKDPIDLLINNAAAPPPELRHTADGFELQFGTDHLSPSCMRPSPTFPATASPAPAISRTCAGPRSSLAGPPPHRTPSSRAASGPSQSS